MAPRAPIATGTTMTFCMRQTFAVSSLNRWYFSNFSSSLSFTLSSPGMATSVMTTSLSFLSSCLNFPSTLDCGIPQYLEVFTFHHSLRLLFTPGISSFFFLLLLLLLLLSSSLSFLLFLLFTGSSAIV